MLLLKLNQNLNQVVKPKPEFNQEIQKTKKSDVIIETKPKLKPKLEPEFNIASMLKDLRNEKNY